MMRTYTHQIFGTTTKDDSMKLDNNIYYPTCRITAKKALHKRQSRRILQIYVVKKNNFKMPRQFSLNSSRIHAAIEGPLNVIIHLVITLQDLSVCLQETFHGVANYI